MVKGTDSKGRGQTIRSSEADAKGLASKFERGKRVNSAIPKIVEAVNTAIATGSEEAAVVRLIYLTGFRNGSEKNTGAKVKAYGATTLRGEHVSIEGDTVTFDFTGKLGVRQLHVVADAALADDMRRRKERGGPLFDTRADKVIAFLRKASRLNDIKAHDLRTWNATELARHIINTEAAPTDEVDYWLKRDAVADIVARKLGDTRSVVLERYIDPIVFAEWQESAKV